MSEQRWWRVVSSRACPRISASPGRIALVGDATSAPPAQAIEGPNGLLPYLKRSRTSCAASTSAGRRSRSRSDGMDARPSLPRPRRHHLGLGRGPRRHRRSAQCQQGRGPSRGRPRPGRSGTACGRPTTRSSSESTRPAGRSCPAIYQASPAVGPPGQTLGDDWPARRIPVRSSTGGRAAAAATVLGRPGELTAAPRTPRITPTTSLAANPCSRPTRVIIV